MEYVVSTLLAVGFLAFLYVKVKKAREARKNRTTTTGGSGGGGTQTPNERVKLK